MSEHEPESANVIPLSPPAAKEPLWRHVIGDVLRRERLAQRRTLKDVAEAARISMPYLSEIERGRKEASSEVLAATGRALGLGLAELLALTQRRLDRPGRAGAATARPVRTSVVSEHELSARRRGSRPGEAQSHRHGGAVLLAA